MKKLYYCLLEIAVASFANDRNAAAVKLDAHNFEETLKTTENVLAAFYAPWCNKCKNFMPEFEKAAIILQNETPPMTLAQIDCTEEHNIDLCISQGVKGYPHLVRYKFGENTGDNPTHLRSSESIQKFMRKLLSFVSFHIKTFDQYEQFITHPDGAIIGVFDSTQGHATLKEADEEGDKKYFYKKGFNKIVNVLVDDHRFAHITDRELADKIYKNEATSNGLWNTVVLHRNLDCASKFEPSFHVYQKDKISAGLVKAWVKGVGVGLCPVVTEDQFHMTPFGNGLVAAYYQVDFTKDPKGSRYWRNRIMKVAVDYPEFQFVVGARKDFEKLILDDLGGSKDWGEKGPKIVIWDKKYDSYRMEIGQNCDPACDMEPDGSNLRAFLDSYKKGEAERFVKSDEPPANNDQPVKIVTGNTFEELVMDETKDVFIEFYAPWCGHCKTLEPIWEALAEKLEGDPNIVVAKIDATGNHPPKIFQYQGFPTIFWSGMGSKQYPKKYEGGRTLEAFIEFAKNNAKITPLILDGIKQALEDDDEFIEDVDYTIERDEL